MNLLIFGLNYDNFSDIEKEIFWQLKSYILNKIPTIIFENKSVNNDSPKLKRSFNDTKCSNKDKDFWLRRPLNYQSATKHNKKRCIKIERQISKSIVLNELNNYLEEN